MIPDTSFIFNIKTSEEFKQAALSVFNFQVLHNPVYRQYIDSLKINVNSVTSLEKIPFLPVEFFKSHKVLVEDTRQEEEDRRQKLEAIKQETQTLNLEHETSKLFTSSGTTGTITSKHYLKDIRVYELSYLKGFEYFYGDIKDYCIIALLPSYLEREGSSLIYMVADLIKKSKHPQSGFYLNNYSELLITLKQLEVSNQKTILLGVSYALLDLAELIEKNRKQKEVFKNTLVMETGGMKGKRREMLKEELQALLCSAFGTSVIHSEYGMTELLSQAYSKGGGLFNCPPWMKVMIRETNDPFAFLPPQKTGGINIIDLANINSCSFIATQDLGKLHSADAFEVLGRFDNSDIRGCNLLMD